MKIYKVVDTEMGQALWFTDKRKAKQLMPYIYMDEKGDGVQICNIETPITRKNLINFLDEYCRFATNE